MELTRLVVLAMLLAIAPMLIGCSSESMLRSADLAEREAERAEKAADTLRRAATHAGGAFEALNDPTVQQVLAWLPANLRDRITGAAAIGADLTPALLDVADELDAIAISGREAAEQYRKDAAAGHDRWTNLALAIGTGSTLFGAIGVFIGRVLGVAVGARQVIQLVNSGRRADPEASEAFFEGKAGREMKERLEWTSKAVQSEMAKHKATVAVAERAER